MSGAEPCTGSYRALRAPVLASGAPREADGSIPMEPVSMAAWSDSMSPNRLSHTITSNCLGLRTSCMAQASARMCCSSTSLASRACVALHLVPQHARLHHVALLGRVHLVAALSRQIE